MLRIRSAQMAAFAQVSRDTYLAERARALRETFPDELDPLSDAELHAQVEAALEKAAERGCTTEQDGARFLNLCVVFGWDFLEQPEHHWMQARYLDNTALGAPGERLRLLVDKCRRRLEVEEHNRNQEL